MTDIISIVSQLGFPATIAIWSLYQLRKQTEDSNTAYKGLSEQFIESLKGQREDYAKVLKEICGNYESLSSLTTGAIEKNTMALNGLEHAIDRMNGHA